MKPQIEVFDQRVSLKEFALHKRPFMAIKLWRRRFKLKQFNRAFIPRGAIPIDYYDESTWPQPAAS